MANSISVCTNEKFAWVCIAQLPEAMQYQTFVATGIPIKCHQRCQHLTSQATLNMVKQSSGFLWLDLSFLTIFSQTEAHFQFVTMYNSTSLARVLSIGLHLFRIAWWVQFGGGALHTDWCHRLQIECFCAVSSQLPYHLNSFLGRLKHWSHIEAWHWPTLST